MPKAKATHKNTLEVVANPRTEKMITPKQEEFCRLYVCEDISQTEAALKAGYSKKSAHAIASQLLNGQRYPHVVNRIRELKIELSKKYEVTFEGHVQKLAQIRDEALANGNYPAAVAAETKRGQAAGLYIDRKEILHGKIDQMSREEVVREIRRLQEEFPALGSVIEGNIVVEEDEEKAD
jgi:phage terminase small subunit|tara:strand:- start:170 stop:709 length:540 start_codon:yes stop_codon:yes gene_type:complete